MRSLSAALIFLFLIFTFCFWNAYKVDQAINVLTKAAEDTADKASVDALIAGWEKKQAFLAFTVNRQMLSSADRSLSQMQSCKADDPLFGQAKSDFLTALSVIRESYGLHFGAIL